MQARFLREALQCLFETHILIKLYKLEYVATSSTAIAPEPLFLWVHREGRFTLGVERT
jgi:hypothetical protein